MSQTQFWHRLLLFVSIQMVVGKNLYNLLHCTFDSLYVCVKACVRARARARVCVCACVCDIFSYVCWKVPGKRHMVINIFDLYFSSFAVSIPYLTVRTSFVTSAIFKRQRMICVSFPSEYRVTLWTYCTNDFLIKTFCTLAVMILSVCYKTYAWFI